MNNRQYTPAQRQEAVALSLTIGQRQAAHQLGIPQRTLSDWQRGTRHPELQAVVVASNADVAERLWRVIDTASSEMERRVTDPKSRLGDVARSLEIAMQAHQLITGGPTSNSHNVNVNLAPGVNPESGLTWDEERDLADWLDQKLADGGDPSLIAASLARKTAIDLRSDVQAEVHEAMADLDETERSSLRSLIRDMARQRLEEQP